METALVQTYSQPGGIFSMEQARGEAYGRKADFLFSVPAGFADGCEG
ncbi:MAG: hypothetical protein IKB97_01060 [Bacteroidaceae bacterium]|nr:hypothetical protein [Bacteroidaceae bacterium]MBR2862137.1 hypothetical protein [Bacteroidaceae bacterium]